LEEYPELSNKLLGLVPKITKAQLEIWESPITLAELTESLKTTKQEKSPGLDGFNVEFYSAFWPELNQFLLNAINLSFKQKILPITFRQGTITLLPK